MAEETQPPAWIVVVAKPAAEELAERSLRQAGYRVYLPRYRKLLHGVRLEGRRRIRTRGPGEIVLRPAMLGYLFAQVYMLDDDYHRAMRCKGVASFLRMGVGDPPAHISEDAVNRIRDDENAGMFDEPRARRGKHVSRPDLAVGDQVRLEIGGMALAATLHSLDHSDRVVISYLLFGREMQARVDAHNLELVDA
jgi:transcription antitermination factor NusG